MKSLLIRANANVFYGFIGYQNLGDEAIWAAAQRLFVDIDLIAYKKYRFKALNNFIKNKNKKSVILGGGTLIGANKVDGSNGFRNDFMRLSESTKHQFVFGTGVGAIDQSNIPDWLFSWQALLTNCSYIGVRGARSKKSLSLINIDSEIVGDTACQWATKITNKPNLKKTIGINVGATKGLIPESGLEVLGEFIRTKSVEGWQITFFVINPDDSQITEQLKNMTNLETVNTIHVYDDTQSYLSALDGISYFIGTRLHAVILAMANAIPSIMLGYADKAADFMESIEMGLFNQDINIVDISSLMETFEKLTEDKSISTNINEAMLTFKFLQENRAKNIAKMLK
ncbi:polysaccharide pyruvyl transferase family protein [Methylophaga pinxianii]|uniref:polysaccharide pyruvyl transferase family protein n=1 Tax=Methylophaga pinxianii TaxID=2881052 RepID=UPI001CF39FFE|nr:polysaccharide pyruvyl transferase family protein [Methylophaga pinxianii]MCB2426631.1 polysaccharide pyruvyl transferase family protein [Methylophaga pinxianii]UPH45109.1 polysaccharide pyruvyl transferase family protein [Methylophaga pinxianii]